MKKYLLNELWDLLSKIGFTKFNINSKEFELEKEFNIEMYFEDYLNEIKE